MSHGLLFSGLIHIHFCPEIVFLSRISTVDVSDVVTFFLPFTQQKSWTNCQKAHEFWSEKEV